MNNELPQNSHVNDETPPTPRSCLIVAGLVAAFLLMMPLCLYIIWLVLLYGRGFLGGVSAG
jgi:hypothetical protein